MNNEIDKAITHLIIENFNREIIREIKLTVKSFINSDKLYAVESFDDPFNQKDLLLHKHIDYCEIMKFIENNIPLIKDLDYTFKYTYHVVGNIKAEISHLVLKNNKSTQ